MELIKSRRSTRVFSKNLIPDETLKTIIEAAHRAPTAKNKQLVEFTIITNKEILSEISTYTVSVFSKIAKKLNNPFIKSIAKPFASEVYNLLPSFLSMQEKFKNGEDIILREATALLLIHSEKNRFAIQDANLAYQNASLMAESMGIGQFYTGFIIAAIDNDNRKNYLSNKLGIKGNIYAGMALGIPKFSYSKYIDKKDISINWIK
jgi:nitroreductase